MRRDVTTTHSSKFGTATFTRAADLACPASACQRAIKEQQFENASTARGAMNCPCAPTRGTRPLSRSCGQCSVGSSTACQRLGDLRRSRPTLGFTPAVASTSGKVSFATARVTRPRGRLGSGTVLLPECGRGRDSAPWSIWP